LSSPFARISTPIASSALPPPTSRAASLGDLCRPLPTSADPPKRQPLSTRPRAIVTHPCRRPLDGRAQSLPWRWLPVRSDWCFSPKSLFACFNDGLVHCFRTEHPEPFCNNPCPRQCLPFRMSIALWPWFPASRSSYSALLLHKHGYSVAPPTPSPTDPPIYQIGASRSSPRLSKPSYRLLHCLSRTIFSNSSRATSINILKGKRSLLPKKSTRSYYPSSTKMSSTPLNISAHLSPSSAGFAL
jgi:hypothetical protein